MQWTERNEGGGTFFQGDATSLDSKEVTMVTQALDNQWLPRDLLEKKPRSLLEVFDERNRFVRREFLRGLLNSKHIVANRAFLFNNQSIHDFYKKPGAEKEMFRRLLGERAILPFFFNEQSPFVRREGELKADEPKFMFIREAFDQWQELCRDARPSCLRLAWPGEDGSDQENMDLITRHLARHFHEFGLTAYQGKFELYANHLGIDESKKKGFAQHLYEIAKWFQEAGLNDDGEPIFRTRNELYARYLVEPGSDTAQGRLDWNKPYVSEVKRLFDLRYNVNLADAIGRFAITPAGSPPRVALQESTLRSQTARSETSAEQMVSFLRGILADTVQRQLDMPLLDHVNLEDIYGVRQEQPWNRYITSFADLIQSVGPETDLATAAAGFGANLHQVFEEYGKVASSLAETTRKRRTDAVASKVAMTCGIVIDIAGVTLACLIPSETGVEVELYRGARENILSVIPSKGIANLAVRLFFNNPTRNDILELQADLMQRKLPKAKEEVDKLVSDLKKLGGKDRDHVANAEEANVNFVDEVGD